MNIQGVSSIFDIRWNERLTWGDLYRENEKDFSRYNFEESDTKRLLLLFNEFESEAQNLFKKGLLYPGYDYAVKCSHIFNLIEARGAISVSERAKMIARVRSLTSEAAHLYIERREKND
jgi:glycyl-tRNA synthetase alpha chain